MANWWLERDVVVLAEAFAKALLVAGSRLAPTGPKGVEDPIERWIEIGEQRLRECVPRKLQPAQES